ncbi:MAG: DUF1553 domain-containing protein [Armatimonadota bacterium]
MRDLIRRWLPAGVAIALGAGAPVLALAATGKAAPSYERDILPLFQARCIGCHGAVNPAAGLDLRQRGDVLEGGASGPSVAGRDPGQSLLYQMLADGRMPKGGGKFSPAELAKVADWIRAGAPGKGPEQGHWAFIPPARPAAPKVRAEDRVRNPIDRFVLAELERQGLGLSPEADRRTLVRRLYFDLLGLPPTPEQVETFVSDPAPDAYERLVETLLASPHYGERWARHWLDTAGYADSEGVLQEDRLRPNAWRYRDYVIRSFNADKPYDRFLREQLAGDELSGYRTAKEFTPEVLEAVTATGFLRTAVDATRDDFNPHQFGEYQYRMLHDTQRIVSTTVLGLTVQCAQCHDHKYEPISQKDYYRLQALFMGAVRPRGALLPTYRRQIVAATAAQQEEAKRVNAAVDAALAELEKKSAALLRDHAARHLEARLPSLPVEEQSALRAALAVEEAKRTPEQKALIEKNKSIAAPTAEELAAAYPEFAKAQGEIRAAREAEAKKRIVYPEIRAFYDQDATPPPTPLLNRGDWLRPGDPVEPGIPAILAEATGGFTLPTPAADAATTGRRTALAQWLTRPDHPLTARVLVNRVWAHHFGEGIVRSLDNFGRSGDRPSHPELLDFLASVFTAPVTPDAVATERQSDRGTSGTEGRRDRGIVRVRTAASREAQPATRAQLSPSLRLSVSPSSGFGWSIKALHRLIVTSAVYRQASALRPEAAAKDPENRLLWRQRARRLEAEAVRDAVLAAAGTLDLKLFGEPVGTETVATGEIIAAGEAGPGRRSIYLLVRRSMPVTLLNTFDAPVMETNCTRRVVSTTATQALAQMNSTFITAQSGNFAARVLKEAPPEQGVRAAADRAYRLALGRGPSPAELAAVLDFLPEQEARYRAAGKAAAEARQLTWADLCQALLSANEFLYVD